MATLDNKLETLIFSGAGALGFAYAGCVNALDELNKLDSITTYGGSSAGSIISYALALGYTASEVEDIVKTTNFGDFLHCPSIGNFVNLQKILTEKGYAEAHPLETGVVIDRLIKHNCMSDNDAAKAFLDGLCIKKYGKALTFQELFEKTNKKLVTTACDIGTKQEKYNSVDTTPSMLVQDAVLASMSIPFVFPPMNLYANQDNCVVDGGTLNNLPVNIGKGTTSLYIVIGQPITDLGSFTETTSFFSFAHNLIDTLLNNSYQFIFSIPEVVENTIQIPIPDGLGALSFNMTPAQQQSLIDNGYNATKSYYS